MKNLIRRKMRQAPARRGDHAVFAPFAVLLASLWFGQASPAVAQNAIVLENQLPGDPQSEWDISGAGDLTIQGFATEISVNRGETVHFKIDTDEIGRAHV